MEKYILKGGVVYHNHRSIQGGDIGICDFTTSNEGLTTIKCRQCGDLTSISEFVDDIRWNNERN